MAKTKILAQVVSINQDTISVLNTYKTKHPKYQKIIKRSKKFLAHNEIKGVVIGDTVEIEECAPISKNKSFRVLRVIK